MDTRLVCGWKSSQLLIICLKAKFDVDIVSIQGGRVPIDRVSIPNGIPREFKHVASLLQNTNQISKVHFWIMMQFYLVVGTERL